MRPPRPTPRGVAVLVVAVLCGGAGLRWGYPVFLALAGLLAGALVAALATAARRPDVDVRRAVHPDRVERGRPALARLDVRRAGGGFTARDRCGPHVRRIVVRSDAVHRYELPTTERGRMTVGPLVVEKSDPLGLARCLVDTGGTATLWVHPRRHPARPFSLGHRRFHHEGATSDRSPHGSLDLREVREYVPGDEVRLVHWKATARTGRMMVRDYADPDRPRFALLLDTRNARAFEEAVEVAASLLHAGAVAGHDCRLLTTCGVDVTARGGESAARRLLDELCVLVVRPGSVPPRPRGGLVVVTAGPLDSIAPLRPDVVFSLGSPGDVVGARVVRESEAADAVSRWNEVTT
ncbi:DUF58 domain-containing protein [Umezawaea tangerina]|uniref:Uncharacterized protein (DUF58 family) n=1 Tax=Umezawaea tangerina TaxID=84725 RepID=A0A2T0TGJ9_9PSEU|nr:DUF58 domain-containing protein [Umezawaea tangerina]PRY44755.1 uncharacterized protein (DUF58 family) [Umezawaea tangerina]